MTPEKFRQWIVILFAVSIATIWVAMGIKLCKWNKYCMMGQKGGIAEQMPGRMPRHAAPTRAPMPTRRAAPTSKPAPAPATAK